MLDHVSMQINLQYTAYVQNSAISTHASHGHALFNAVTTVQQALSHNIIALMSTSNDVKGT